MRDLYMNYDIILIGAGPAGLSFARSLAGTGLSILVIEKSPLDNLKEPTADGREIALTHHSIQLLKDLQAWSHIPAEVISPIKQAKVVNGNSSYPLCFDRNKDDIDALAYLVPNYLIRKSLFETLQGFENVEILAGTSVEKVSTNSQYGSVVLSNGETISAPLIVAADSRFSDTRRMMGIAASLHDFSRVAIACRMEHEKPNKGIAVECFNYGRTLAILPMNGDTSSIVITVTADQAEQLIGMDNECFSCDVEQHLNGRLGQMKLIGQRYAYPLVAVHAKQFVGNRFALIGDAAVGMHPVTAHGFNLGIRGQNTLAHGIKSALKSNSDIGSQKVLLKYQSKHMKITKPLYYGTNGLVKLYTNENLPAKVARSVSLRLANNMSPIKRFISRRLAEDEKGRGISLPF